MLGKTNKTSLSLWVHCMQHVWTWVINDIFFAFRVLVRQQLVQNLHITIWRRDGRPALCVLTPSELVLLIKWSKTVPRLAYPSMAGNSAGAAQNRELLGKVAQSYFYLTHLFLHVQNIVFTLQDCPLNW